VQFESDCSNLIKAIKDGDQDLSDIGVLYREARSLKLMHFDTADFLFCRRECNKVAHRLAQFRYQDDAISSRWMDAVPELVSVLIDSDLAVQQV
jgi:hypothetical protein